MIERSRAVILLALAIVIAGVLSLGASPAVARPPQYQFNILGGQNASNWGNQGRLFSVDFWWQQVQVMHDVYGFDWPNVVTGNEVCWVSPFGSSPHDYDNAQFTQMMNRLLYVTGGQYTWYYPAVGDPSTKFRCSWNRPAVLARANSTSSKWANDLPYELAMHGGNHQRYVVCTFPTLGWVNYLACSTHLDNSSAASPQATEALQVFNAYGAYSIFEELGGDFNLTPNASSLADWYAVSNEANQGINQFTHSSATPERKIDYIWYRGASWQSSGGRFRPPTCNSWGGDSCLILGSGNRLSDHYMLRGDYW